MINPTWRSKIGCGSAPIVVKLLMKHVRSLGPLDSMLVLFSSSLDLPSVLSFVLLFFCVLVCLHLCSLFDGVWLFDCFRFDFDCPDRVNAVCLAARKNLIAARSASFLAQASHLLLPCCCRCRRCCCCVGGLFASSSHLSAFAELRSVYVQNGSLLILMGNGRNHYRPQFLLQLGMSRERSWSARSKQPQSRLLNSTNRNLVSPLSNQYEP